MQNNSTDVSINQQACNGRTIRFFNLSTREKRSDHNNVWNSIFIKYEFDLDTQPNKYEARVFTFMKYVYINTYPTTPSFNKLMSIAGTYA